MDKDYQEYKDFDMTGATRGIPPQIARLQAKRKAEREQQGQSEISPIEPDVWQLILKKANNATEMAKINQVLRIMLA